MRLFPSPRATSRTLLVPMLLSLVVSLAGPASAAEPVATPTPPAPVAPIPPAPVAPVPPVVPVLPVLPLPPAPVPSAPAFSAAIEPAPGWEPETTCSPVEKPGVQAVRALLQATYGSLAAMNIVRGCTAAHSGHEEGRSLDWMTNVRVPEQAAAAEAFVKWLEAPDSWGNASAMARRMGVAYIIWNGRMWRSYAPERGWTEYAKCWQAERVALSYDNTCHRNHVHVSFSWEGAFANTSFYTGRVRRPCAAAVPLPRFSGTLGSGMRAVPLSPRRLLDTRKGVAACRLPARGRYDVKVTGVGGVPATGVGAVVVNLTGTKPAGDTFLSAYPAGTSWPGNSSVNVPAAGDASALVVVPVGVNGMISVLNAGRPVDVVVDVVGYFATDGSGAPHTAVVPERALDSRKTSTFGARETRRVPLAGKYGVPKTATGVLVNVTSTRSQARGYVTVAPSIKTRPRSSTVNFAVRDTVANRALVQLSSDGGIDVYASAATHVVIDVVGWFGKGGDGLTYTALNPKRILDTRNGTGVVRSLRGGASERLVVAGVAGVPSDAKGVVATLTVTKPTSSTHAVAWASGTTPGTSDVNVPAGGTRANLVSTAASDGAVSLTIGSGKADAVADVLGYYR